IVTYELNLPAARYDSAFKRVQFHAAYLDRVRAIPGVVSAGVTSWLPANGNYHIWGYSYLDATGQDAGIAAQVRVVDGDLFKTLGIPLVAGRLFTASDRLDTEDVAIISRTIVKRVYGDRDPL